VETKIEIPGLRALQPVTVHTDTVSIRQAFQIPGSAAAAGDARRIAAQASRAVIRESVTYAFAAAKLPLD
jgi:hypothetical protein